MRRWDGEEFSWSKDVIAKMLRKIAEKVESEEVKKKRLYLSYQVNDSAQLATASSGLGSKKASLKRRFFIDVAPVAYIN